MNRAKKFFICLLISMVTCFSFLLVACGNNVEGTYKFKKLTYQEGGLTVELEAGEKFMGAITLSEDFIVITLNKDGSAVMSMQTEGEELSTGTWVKGEEGKIVLDFGEAQTVACDGKTMDFEIDGVSLILEK